MKRRPIINKLDEQEFLKYFCPPMRLLKDEEERLRINIQEYVLTILDEEGLDFALEQIEVSYVYVDSNHEFEHVLLSYGVDDVFIVVIISKGEIIGFHNLDLKEKYGVENEG